MSLSLDGPSPKSVEVARRQSGVVAYLTCRASRTSPARPFPSLRTSHPMKLTPWYLAAIAPIAVAGCSGAFLGHFAVLAVTLGIFIGTLQLGKQQRGELAVLETQTQTEIPPTVV